MTDIASLEALFGRANAPGWSPYISSRDGEIFERTRGSAVVCTSYALEVEAELGRDRVEVLGFHCVDNPGTAVETICDGHDFAVVDGRYVVDGWIAFVESISERSVFDMEDASHLAEIRRLYGDRMNWEPCD